VVATTRGETGLSVFEVDGGSFGAIAPGSVAKATLSRTRGGGGEVAAGVGGSGDVVVLLLEGSVFTASSPGSPSPSSSSPGTNTITKYNY